MRGTAPVSLFILGFAGMVGCGGEAPPPLDSLSLREALSAEPRVIAGLPQAARKKLAERLEAARTEAVSTETLGVDPAAMDAARGAAVLLRGVDAARERAGRDAVIVAQVERGPDQVFVHPVPDAVAEGDGVPLPPWNVEGETAEAEKRALAGAAGASLRALMAASGARRLVRVVAWPSAAVAVGDSVYVNAAWLVALSSREEVDAGAGGDVAAAGSRGARRGGSAVMPIVLVPASAPEGESLSTEADPNGDIPPDLAMPNRQPQPQKGCGGCGSSSTGNVCAGTACAACLESAHLCSSCDSSSCDEESCDSSSDSCESGDSCDSGGESCDSGGGSCGGESCRIGSRRLPVEVPVGALAWMMAPLALLLVEARKRR